MYQICTNFSSSVSWNIYSCPFQIWSQDTLFRRGWDKFPTGEKKGIHRGYTGGHWQWQQATTIYLTMTMIVMKDGDCDEGWWLWWRWKYITPPSQWVSGYFRLCFHLESSPWSFYLIFPKTWTDQSIQKFTFQKYKTLATLSRQFRKKEHRMGGQAKLCLSI